MADTINVNIKRCLNFILLLVFICSGILTAQKRVDSLVAGLNGKAGAERFEQLLKISFELLFNDPEKASEYTEEALKIATGLKDEEKKGRVYFANAQINHRLGKKNLALELLTDAREIYTKLNNKFQISQIDNITGLIYTDLKRYDLALDIFTRVLNYYNETGRLADYASILINVANIFLDKKNFDKALEGYFKVLEIEKKLDLKNKELLGIVYCNIGETYYNKGQYDLAFKYRKMSLDTYEEMNFLDGIANLQMDVGMSLMKLKDFSQASEYLNKALTNYKKIKYSEGTRRVIESMVLLSLERNQMDNALGLCWELEKMSLADQDSAMLSKCYGIYAKIYHQTGEYESAAHYYKKYIQAKENLDAKENRQRMTELQNAFETEQKDYENKTLRQENELQREKLNSRDNLLIAVTFGVLITFTLLIVLFKKEKKIRHINEQIQEQNRRLEEHIVSKDKFFSILGHNLKNPFWAVLGQNRLLEDEYDELTESERKELISRIGSSANNVYKLFEDLLRWARTQQNAIEVEKERLSLKTLIESSIRPYASMAENKKVRIEVSVREETEIEGDRFMLETVIGNLIDNAIKFSLQEEMILVSGYSTGETVVIRVEDYGVGMAQEKLEKLFRIDEDISSAGTLNEKGTGLGLIICKEFVEKHGGTIKVESREGKGTAFNVILPVKK